MRNMWMRFYATNIRYLGMQAHLSQVVLWQATSGCFKHYLNGWIWNIRPILSTRNWRRNGTTWWKYTMVMIVSMPLIPKEAVKRDTNVRRPTKCSTLSSSTCRHWSTSHHASLVFQVPSVESEVGDLLLNSKAKGIYRTWLLYSCMIKQRRTS